MRHKPRWFVAATGRFPKPRDRKPRGASVFGDLLVMDHGHHRRSDSDPASHFASSRNTARRRFMMARACSS